MSALKSQTNRVPARAFAGESRLQIVLFALVVPVLVWAINTGLLNTHRYIPGSMGLGLLVLYVVFVIETALIAWTVGRYVQHVILRWFVFLWCIVFIDVLFVLFQFTFFSDLCSVSYAFASAQLGLLIAWAILGTQPLSVRITAALLGTAAVMLYASTLTIGMRNDWDTILSWQAIATVGLCAALRWRRFRILPMEAILDSERTNDASTERVQFSIMHVLIWTSALAPIFAVARIVDWDAIQMPTITSWVQFLMLVIVLALTPLVAIWSGLGQGNVMLRFLVPLLFTGSTGAFLAYAMSRGWLRYIDIDVYRLSGIEPYIFWISWTVLAGFFYLAMLLILRATDQRLLRVS